MIKGGAIKLIFNPFLYSWTPQEKLVQNNIYLFIFYLFIFFNFTGFGAALQFNQLLKQAVVTFLPLH